MWPQGFNNLEELKLFLVEQLNYNEEKGFSFLQIPPGMVMSEIVDILGEPHQSSFEAKEQQTMHYDALIDHPVHGKRDHHKLNALFWAFHHEPLEIIRLHIYYYRMGEFESAFQEFIKELFAAIIEKFGKPDKKVFRGAAKDVSYLRGKHTFFIWSNVEGIRIQIKS